MADQKAPRCAILIPSGRSWEADTAMSVVGVVSYAGMRGVSAMVINEKSSMISQARNNLLKRAIEHGAEYGLFLDSDMTFPPETLIQLLSRQKSIIGCFYSKRVPPFETLGIPSPGSDPLTGGVHLFDMLPAGCLLIKLSILSSIPSPWFFETQRRPGSPLKSLIQTIEDHCAIPLGPSARAIIEDREVKRWAEKESETYNQVYRGGFIGEDYNFCIKAKRYGHHTFCDSDLSFQLGHIGEQIITCQRPENKAPDSGLTLSQVDACTTP